MDIDIKEYASKWTFMRFVQLGIGIAFLVSYIQEGGALSLGFAGLMMVQAVLNIGCFSSQGCSTPPYKDTDKHEMNQEVEYEEIN